MGEATIGVGSAEFVASLQPLLDHTIDLCSVSLRDIGHRARPPAANSRAMHDLSTDQPFIDQPLHAEPIASVHQMICMTTFAAVEHLGTAARLVRDSVDGPVYSHDVLCRSAIDAAGTASWLAEPRISTLRRVQRGLAEQIYSADQMRLYSPTVTTARAKGDEVGKRLRSYASSRSWPCSPRKDTNSDGRLLVGTEQRPTPRQSLEVALGDRGLAEAMWRLLSAVVHSTTYGLAQSVQGQARRPASHVAPIGPTSVLVEASIRVAGQCVHRSVSHALQYFGWMSHEWSAASAALLATWRTRSVTGTAIEEAARLREMGFWLPS